MPPLIVLSLMAESNDCQTAVAIVAVVAFAVDDVIVAVAFDDAMINAVDAMMADVFEL